MTAVELGCPYIITGPDNSRAVLNVPTDPDFVGYCTDVTGLDMYGVRENAQSMPAGDGGYHGPFWRDRRPFTLSGFIFPTMPILVRDNAQDKLLGVMGQCFRNDGILQWTPADGVQRGVNFRIQQPVRLTKGQSNVERNLMVAAVARDWRIIQWAQSSANGAYSGSLPVGVACNNTGNADAAPIFTITGPLNGPSVTNNNTGKAFNFVSGSSISAGQTLVIDLTGVYPVVTLNGSDVSYAVDPIYTDWTIAVAKGNNEFLLNGGGAGAGTSLQVAWHNSWH